MIEPQAGQATMAMVSGSRFGQEVPHQFMTFDKSQTALAGYLFII
jgi:hypothetical protein